MSTLCAQVALVQVKWSAAGGSLAGCLRVDPGQAVQLSALLLLLLLLLLVVVVVVCLPKVASEEEAHCTARSQLIKRLISLWAGRGGHVPKLCASSLQSVVILVFSACYRCEARKISPSSICALALSTAFSLLWPCLSAGGSPLPLPLPLSLSLPVFLHRWFFGLACLVVSRRY